MDPSFMFPKIINRTVLQICIVFFRDASLQSCVVIPSDHCDSLKIGEGGGAS